jgi:hypothetical protein
MERFVSHSPSRRECWKGHGDKASVRKSIAYARRHPWVTDLRIFAAGTSTGYDAFIEIPAAEWDEAFAEGEA